MNWWSKLTKLTRILVALFVSIAIVVSVAVLFGKRLAEYSLLNLRNEMQAGAVRELAFSRQEWISDFPWGSRHAMAKRLAESHDLLGMTDVAVKQMLGFGQFKNDFEAPGADNTKILGMKVTAWHCEYGANFYVTLKDGKVIETTFSEEP